MSERIHFNKVDHPRFVSWAKRHDWFLGKHDSIWTSEDKPVLDFWLETWITPAGIIIQIEKEIDE
jgi:hypothetical protein